MTNPSYVIRRPEQIRALRSPVRQEIVDTVQSLGACSVADIARELGRHADGLYYHVRALVKVDLLRPAGTRADGGRPEALYSTRSPDHPMKLRYDPDDAANAEAVLGAVGSMLRMTERDFARAFGPDASTDGPGRNLWAARAKAWLSDDDLLEVNRLLGELQAIFERVKEPGRDRLHTFTFVIAPVPARSVRREGD